MTIEFTNLNAGEQRVKLYEKISAIEEHLKRQNGNIARNTEAIEKNCKALLVIKVLGIVVFVLGCVLLGFGVPNIPIL